jgi:hypothetical protein
MAFLSVHSRFAVVQNDGPYLPRITRETCTAKFEVKVLRITRFTSMLLKLDIAFWNLKKKKLFGILLFILFRQRIRLFGDNQ